MKTRPQLAYFLGISFVTLGLLLEVEGSLPWTHGTALALFLSAYLAYRVSPKLPISLAATFLLLIAQSFLAPLPPWLILSFLGFSGLSLLPPMRRAMQNPNKRWWLQARRRKVELPVHMVTTEGRPVQSKMFDLSTSGIFVAWDEDEPFQVGDQISLRLPLEDDKKFSCFARVVRRSDGKGRYPQGFGMEFMHLSRSERQQLDGYLKSATPYLDREVDFR